MTFKITASERKDIEEAVDATTNARESLEAAIAEANEKIADITRDVQNKIDSYNDAVGTLRQEIDCLHDRLNCEYDERSEKWQESDKGVEIRSWIDIIGDEVLSYVDELDIELIAQIDINAIDWADTIVNENMKWTPED